MYIYLTALNMSLEINNEVKENKVMLAKNLIKIWIMGYDSKFKRKLPILSPQVWVGIWLIRWRWWWFESLLGISAAVFIFSVCLFTCFDVHRIPMNIFNLSTGFTQNLENTPKHFLWTLKFIEFLWLTSTNVDIKDASVGVLEKPGPLNGLMQHLRKTKWRPTTM